MRFFQNNLGDLVSLLPETTTNTNGNKLLWVKCANGVVVSIWENEFKNNFHEIHAYP